jgi:hypothetical protein
VAVIGRYRPAHGTEGVEPMLVALILLAVVVVAAAGLYTFLRQPSRLLANGEIKPSHTGAWIYRVHYSAQSDWRDANSKKVTIKVTRKQSTTPPAAACYPLTNGGNSYEPGEFCRSTDHGVSGVAGDGEAIKYEANNSWRWEPV